MTGTVAEHVRTLRQWLAAERTTTELVVERARQAFGAPP
jgi:hypothetical protein